MTTLGVAPYDMGMIRIELGIGHYIFDYQLKYDLELAANHYAEALTWLEQFVPGYSIQLVTIPRSLSPSCYAWPKAKTAYTTKLFLFIPEKHLLQWKLCWKQLEVPHYYQGYSKLGDQTIQEVNLIEYCS